MSDKTFGIIFVTIWLVGLIGSFILAYIICKINQKDMPNKTYKYRDVFKTQYEIGGPLVAIPILGIVLDIYVIVCMIIERYHIKFTWLDKEI